MPLGSIDSRTLFDIWQQPAYAYGVYSAAYLANRLGIREISAVEFGVAGGDGLVALENHCRLIGPRFNVDIKVYGFDSGSGMPQPVDYRDIQYVWNAGYYAMDVDAVRARLTNAQLILGNVAETVPQFLDEIKSPIGFVSFDLDYYSSTMNAFEIFNGSDATHLPRVFCYFDDLIWPERACFNEYTGEYRAINEFNDKSQDKKIAKWQNLSWTRAHAAAWNDEMYVFHHFSHADYNTNLTPPEGRQS
jgi:hypothetical protein